MEREPIAPDGWTADSMDVRMDSLNFTADGGTLTPAAADNDNAPGEAE